jgi:hypothetical protein
VEAPTRRRRTHTGELAARYDLDDELAGRLAAIDAITDAAIAS